MTTPDELPRDNVIHIDFGGEAPLLTARCDVLYRDGEVTLTRTEIRAAGETWVSHGLYPA